MKTEEAPEDTLQAYCVMCQNGAEHSVCERISQCAPDVTALVPVRVIEEKRNKRWQAFEKTLIPGYVFCYAKQPLPEDLVRSVRKIYKVLAYERGMRALHHEDRSYAMWLYRHQGKIEPSTVLEKGRTITVIDGPLKDMTGKIIRLDKRKRKVWVSFDFDGESRRVSLSAHVLTQTNESNP